MRFELVERLEARGLTVWIAPRDISPAADWAAEIIDAISAARLMVLRVLQPQQRLTTAGVPRGRTGGPQAGAGADVPDRGPGALQESGIFLELTALARRLPGTTRASLTSGSAATSRRCWASRYPSRPPRGRPPRRQPRSGGIHRTATAVARAAAGASHRPAGAAPE